ncbi:hypothetical protein [Paenibacillus thiaminolyticus]|uniref:hypothetical protein n=1 Tax=Paenibacillus thiaminolyticus TaxID=49283 RepID=UPI002543471C|nr:hypothetical protein [Paenibacillus thiaminolyticus]WII38818.1 hypothetical protein O0V01_06840 [Paenibacillus thiaminolyticus]
MLFRLFFLAIAARLRKAGGECHSPSFAAQSGPNARRGNYPAFSDIAAAKAIDETLSVIADCCRRSACSVLPEMGTPYFDKRKGIISRIARA